MKKSSGLQQNSNGLAMSVRQGLISTVARPEVITHIEDVARIHIAALDEEKVLRNQTYILEGGKEGEKVVFEDVNEIIRREFPGAVERGWVKGEGKPVPAYQVIDSSETKKKFGELKGYDEVVRDLLKQWVRLKEEGRE